MEDHTSGRFNMDTSRSEHILKDEVEAAIDDLMTYYPDHLTASLLNIWHSQYASTVPSIIPLDDAKEKNCDSTQKQQPDLLMRIVKILTRYVCSYKTRVKEKTSQSLFSPLLIFSYLTTPYSRVRSGNLESVMRAVASLLGTSSHLFTLPKTGSVELSPRLISPSLFSDSSSANTSPPDTTNNTTSQDGIVSSSPEYIPLLMCHDHSARVLIIHSSIIVRREWIILNFVKCYCQSFKGKEEQLAQGWQGFLAFLNQALNLQDPHSILFLAR